MNGLKIIIPGLFTTIQDGGRTGHMASGFSQCGAMDRDAMYLANILVGNNFEDAVAEMTLTGLTAKAGKDCLIAVTGADAEVFVNGEKTDTNRAVFLKRDDYITIGQITNGCRCYLAVKGGIDVPEKMGSRSTFIKIGMGGFEGRKLQSGDILPIKESAEPKNIKNRFISTEKTGNTVILRAVAGPQDDMFSEDELNKFFSRDYKVTPSSDRMGIRLEGEEAIVPISGSDIISDGIVLGSVQVPKNGQPIILCADRQTTGGYAKIVTVISSDMSECAQLTPGKTVRFKRVSVEEAQRVRNEKIKYFKDMKKRIK